MNLQRPEHFTEEAAITWWHDLVCLGVALHPDDTAHEIVYQTDGRTMFTFEEAERIDQTTERFFATFGDRVYELATLAWQLHGIAPENPRDDLLTEKHAKLLENLRRSMKPAVV
jgi:hypothetical protein